MATELDPKAPDASKIDPDVSLTAHRDPDALLQLNNKLDVVSASPRPPLTYLNCRVSDIVTAWS